MSTPKTTPPGRKEWTEAERATLRRMLRYGASIFIAISVTLLIVGTIASIFHL